MIPGDLLSAFPHRQSHTLPGLLDSWAALPNSYPNACMPMQGGNLYHFYDGLWYDPAERRIHDLPCERLTRYRLSQPDTVKQLFINPLQVTWLTTICGYPEAAHFQRQNRLNIFWSDSQNHVQRNTVYCYNVTFCVTHMFSVF